MADTFGNSLFGTCHHIVHGKVVFRDEKNQLTGVLDVGSVRNRPRDCFEGWIEKDGVKVCIVLLFSSSLRIKDAVVLLPILTDLPNCMYPARSISRCGNAHVQRSDASIAYCVIDARSEIVKGLEGVAVPRTAVLGFWHLGS